MKHSRGVRKFTAYPSSLHSESRAVDQFLSEVAGHRTSQGLAGIDHANRTYWYCSDNNEDLKGEQRMARFCRTIEERGNSCAFETARSFVVHCLVGCDQGCYNVEIERIDV